MEGILQQQINETSKERGSENEDLFDAAEDVEWIRGAATELHCSIHASSMEGLGHSLQFMLATDLWENLNEAVQPSLLVRSNYLVSSMKAKEKDLLPYALLPEFSNCQMEKTMSTIDRPFSSEAKCSVRF